MIKKKVTRRSDLDKIRKHFQETSGGGEYEDKWFSVDEPKKGQKVSINIRILPPWGKSADGFFYFTGGLHYKFNIGGKNRALACPEASGRGKCPVCAFVAKLRRSEDEEHEKLVKGWGSNISMTRSYWVNVVSRDDPGKIKIYSAKNKLIETILDYPEDITDPETGRDVTIIRRGKGSATRYNYVIRNSTSKVKYDPKDMWQLDKDILEWMSYDDMVDALRENYGDEMREVGYKPKSSSGEVEKLKRGNPRKKKVEKVKTKKHRYDEDEEEVEEIDEEDVEDMDEDEVDIENIEDEDEE